ncbi:MAG TPA: hypothetical protein VF538_08360 [Pyrinomonadaceae bacterium]|jgi:hypothetical protein
MADGNPATGGGPPKTEDAPSPWDSIGEHSRTVITLASGLLALTVTFSSSIIGKGGNYGAKASLIALWAILVLAVAFSALSSIYLVAYLKDGQRRKETIFFANAAMFLLLSSGVGLLALGTVMLFYNKPWDAAASVEKALSDMPRVSGRKDSKWVLQSLQRDETAKLYKLVVSEDGGQLKYALSVDADTSDIKKADPVP